MCCTNTCKAEPNTTTTKQESIIFRWIVLNSLNREREPQTIALCILSVLLPLPPPSSPPSNCGIHESIRLFWFAGGMAAAIIFTRGVYVIEFFTCTHSFLIDFSLVSLVFVVFYIVIIKLCIKLKSVPVFAINKMHFFSVKPLCFQHEPQSCSN